MKHVSDGLMEQLSPSVAVALATVPPSLWDTAQEVRLRVGQPLRISTREENHAFGEPLAAATVQDCFWRLCAGAVHAHEQELAQGFITAKGGMRVGVAGTAVWRGGTVTAYRDITSLCIRVVRDVDDCAAPLLSFITQSGGIESLLLCGAPASGKTTLLRDIARALSQTYRVAVVDERGELASCQTSGCDVLKGCPKTSGILQAVRTLAPDVVIADELGEDAEWEAVAKSAYCGVPLIASAHIGTPSQLHHRAALRSLLENGGFSLVAFLPPRQRCFDETRIWKARDLLEDRGDRVRRVRLRGRGDRVGGSPA